jgi:DNA mismatch repair protein MutS
MPRLVGRAGLGQATPRDLAALRDGLLALPKLGVELDKLTSPLFAGQKEKILGLDKLAETLAKTLTQNPPITLSDGGVIAPGVDPELDEERSFSTQGKDWIASLQAKLKAETGIPSLKVGFNRVFGYYIEVTKTHLNKVPETFIRKQTLVASERYITPELKEWESKVLGAEEKALELEKKIFLKLRKEVADHSRPLMASARALAVVDVLASFAELALSKDWARPVLKENGSLEIKSGRHPVVEDMLPEGEFVPNDIHLDDENQQVMIITGPNMAGKSTILRQTALIVLLAQTGSFVPAESARIPLTDRIFTRVGAMDDLAGGRSTFMVEMTETSRILEQATFRSLVILDEIGRGTSTYDGLSIAWAVAEHLHNLDQKGVKTLFATHYHELTDLAGECPRVKNYNVAAKEYQGGIVFLRKLKPGGVSRSYGLQVAKLAGLPQNVLKRAQDILNGLEKDGRAVKSANQDAKSKKQLPLFEAALHPVLKSLKELDTDNLTPVQALSILDEMKRAVS